MIAFPFFPAFTTPLAETFATFLLEDLKLTFFRLLQGRILHLILVDFPSVNIIFFVLTRNLGAAFFAEDTPVSANKPIIKQT